MRTMWISAFCLHVILPWVSSILSPHHFFTLHQCESHFTCLGL